MKVNKFIFDVDGTLTPSRGKMDHEFRAWFNTFCLVNDVYLVTGSDKPKTVEQVGETFNLAKTVYNCSGSDVYEKNNNVYTSDWKLPNEAEQWLLKELDNSKFPLRTGLHIENRPGMVNFSIVGRNATMGERKLYVEHDKNTEERHTIAKFFEEKFPDIQAVVGGDTGIDIYPIGSDKSQILRDFDLKNNFLYFFGDKMDMGGNDYPLKMKLLTDKWSCKTVAVEGWEDTFKHLQEIERNDFK